MSFGFNEDQVDERGAVFPKGPQIENVYLNSASYVAGEDKHGNPYHAIDFIYSVEVNDKTAILKDRRFPINESQVAPRNNETHSQAVNREWRNFNSMLLHIAGCFGLSREDLYEATKDTDSFKETASAYCDLINDHCNDVPLWIKTYPDKAGYTRIGKYAPFIQAMSNPPCELSYTKWEKNAASANLAPVGAVEAVDDWASDDEEDF